LRGLFIEINGNFLRNIEYLRKMEYWDIEKAIGMVNISPIIPLFRYSRLLKEFL